MVQTCNAAMNYGNRNASSTYSVRDLARGYCGAVVTSCSIAIYTRTIFSPLLATSHGSRLIMVNAILNYLAAAFAGAFNLVLMRYKEWNEGIKVWNKEGTINYGKSVKAGRKALKETAFTRFFLPLPVLFIPAISHLILEKGGLIPKGLIGGKLLEIGLVCVGLGVGLPMSIALFN
jgi:hypothetical protein